MLCVLIEHTNFVLIEKTIDQEHRVTHRPIVDTTPQARSKLFAVLVFYT